MKHAAISIILLLFLGALALGQQQSEHPLVTSDLIAWSSMQQPHQPEHVQPRPQPGPDPAPETQPAPNPIPSAGPPQRQASRSASDRATPTAQVFTGSIVKEGDSFRLKVSPTTSYKLDNQHQAQEFEGQRVQVTGTLDADQTLIHVDKIEPLS